MLLAIPMRLRHCAFLRVSHSPIEGASIDTNVAVADIGLDLGLSLGSKLALRYSSQIGADSFENNLSARLDIRF